VTTTPDSPPDELHAAIRELLWQARSVAVAAHLRPDGDAVGAVTGLGLALEQAGKQVQMVLYDGVPHPLRFIPGSERITRAIANLETVDLVVVVDSADLGRVGPLLGERAPDLNIDHHITNPLFARANLVLPEFVATCAIIGEFLPRWGFRYNVDIASALLTGLVTDSIGFRTSNMNPQALRLAATLMEHGADLPELYQRALVSKTFPAARYWGLGLSRLQGEPAPINNGEEPALGLVWTSLTLEDRAAAGYPGNDDADLVNVLSSIDADIAVIFVEQKNGQVKISWRARPGIDVSKIALQFGGGGHPAASGATISGPLAEAQQKVLAATREALAGDYADRGE
jgi:phosphoesterase RecJ-like protein